MTRLSTRHQIVAGSDPDIPDRLPDRFERGFRTEIWDLGGGYELKVHLNGAKHWYLNGKRHREDGPAMIQGNIVEYWLNDKQVIYKDYDSPEFEKRWQKLVDLERVRQVMED